MGKKICFKCGAKKPVANFSLRASGKHRNDCKECHNQQAKERYFRDLEKNRAARREYKKTRPEKTKEYRKRYFEKDPERRRRLAKESRLRCKDSLKSQSLRWLYGITINDYRRMIEEQCGKCAICKEETKLVVDHCHSTGKVRGLLCGPCNFGIGNFKENKTALAAAIVYLGGYYF